MEMTLRAADLTQPEANSWLASDVAEALLHFLAGVQAIQSVKKVRYSADAGQLDLWILLTSEDIEDAKRIYLLERSLRQRVGLVALNVNVIPLSEIDAENLPPSEVLIER
jgi:hypothetical protein